MKKALSHILIILALVVAVSACSDKGRIIPKRKMVLIYGDMFMADQWLDDYPDYKTKADTTLFYERIFNKYGYTFKDYDASINYYIDRPDKFTKVFKQVQANLMEQSNKYNDLERLSDQANTLNSKSFGYVRKSFDTDSRKWEEDTLLIWPEFISATVDSAAIDSVLVDSLLNKVIKVDSLAAAGITIPDVVKNKILDASRKNGVRPDKEQALRKLPGDQSVTVQGQAL